MLFIIVVLAIVVAFAASTSLRKKGKKQEASFTLLGAVVGIVIAGIQLFTVIPAGTVGVVDFLGVVSDNTLKPGVNLVNPLANVHKFSIKTQEIKEVMNVPSKEGLPVELEISLLFNLDPENANEIYKTVGPDYRNVILIPQFRSVVRGVTAKYEARALYTGAREQLADEIRTQLGELVGPRGILIDSAPMRQINLPARLTQSIEEKLQAEQESQRMEFVLERERKEAERKKIEAQGISDFQKIVSQGIDKNLLQWKGIEATEKLAQSNNTKVIVIGAGDDGLPIILGGNN